VLDAPSAIFLSPMTVDIKHQINARALQDEDGALCGHVTMEFQSRSAWKFALFSLSGGSVNHWSCQNYKKKYDDSTECPHMHVSLYSLVRSGFVLPASGYQAWSMLYFSFYTYVRTGLWRHGHWSILCHLRSPSLTPRCTFGFRRCCRVFSKFLLTS